ncbi:unnamed protein product [Thelazia callipaeda]|uniref:SSD domain-containing protein n=1 Tax=Thelazia callipaeda TaxID=103827 RepID=A0A158RCR1_THECL|nr:unnamed protein product [Thelazia callipaeda]
MNSTTGMLSPNSKYKNETEVANMPFSNELLQKTKIFMENYIREFGEFWGCNIARYPYKFVILPTCSFCIFFIPFLNSFRQLFQESSAIGSSELFMPRNSATEQDRIRIEKIFPHGIYFHDRTFLSPNLRIINFEILSGSIYEPKFVEFYQNLRNTLELLNVKSEDDTISYSKLCSKAVRDGVHCLPDVFLLSYTFFTLFQPAKYPVWNIAIFNTSTSILTAMIFGGVQNDSSSHLERIISSARCVRMIFNFPPPYRINEFNKVWDNYVQHSIKQQPSNIRITHWSYSQCERDMKEIAVRSRRLLPLLTICLISFCCLSSRKCACDLKFAILSIYGILSAACGIVTAFGFLHVIGIRLVQIALITPFLVLSIGIDDMFIMLAVFEETVTNASKGQAKCCYLMTRTFRESMVSILLTTISNVLVFTFGSFSPFPIIQIFCIYSAVSLAVVFIFQITLYGSLLALKAENILTQRNFAIASSQRSCAESNKESQQSSAKSEYSQRSFLSVYATVFKNKYFITLISTSYIIYLTGSIIILNKKIDIGLQLSSLLLDDTNTYKYLTMYEKYFSEYHPPLEIVLPDKVDYFDVKVQRRVLRAVEFLENTSYTMTASFWLPVFLDFLQKNGNKMNTEVFREDSDSFEKNITNFLQNPAHKHFSNDIILERSNSSRVSVKSSRLHIPLCHITRTSRSDAMHLLRNKVKFIKRRYSIRLLIYHALFEFAEQDDLMVYITFSNAILAGATSLGAVLVLIPSFISCLLMTWAIISINLGVLSLLAVCGTNLDIISATVMLLSIGHTLSIVSWPIIQASLSTMIGVFCLIPVNGYIVKTFILGVLFVCWIGLYHSIVLLPALFAFCTVRLKLFTLHRQEYIVEICGGILVYLIIWEQLVTIQVIAQR